MIFHSLSAAVYCHVLLQSILLQHVRESYITFGGNALWREGREEEEGVGKEGGGEVEEWEMRRVEKREEREER